MCYNINGDRLMNEYKVIYTFNPEIDEALILGPNDVYLKIIENKYGVSLAVRQGSVTLGLEDLKCENEIIRSFTIIENLILNNIDFTESEFRSIINNVSDDNYRDIVNIYLKKEIIYTAASGKSIYPRTLNQKLYIRALENNDIVFALGPAGTGKTYLAVLFALKYLKTNQIKKIILVRPIVEAGEKLGFLPGDLKEKVDPYLVPIYDGLYDTLGKDVVTKMIEKGTIEVAPLAYMRGRTLENSIIILDEAQNSTLSQMKMFLTRLGFKSKMIITGDITQIDLPYKNQSGLIEATNLLEDVEGIKIIKFQKDDVMRHPLVFKIIERYENR